MSDIWLFGVGSVVFIMTTWATLAFLLSRWDTLYRRDLAESPAISEVQPEGDFTERHIPSETQGQP